MKKKTLSLVLALAMCLGLTIPAFAVGETTIQDNGGYSYTLSKPVVGTRVDEQHGITYYQIPEGTIITPVLPEGTVKEELEAEEYYMGGRLVYKLPNGEGVVYVVGIVFDSIYGGYDVQWFGDLEGMSTFDFPKATPTQPLPATPPFEGYRGYCLSRGFHEDYNSIGDSDHYTYLWFEIVPDSGSAASASTAYASTQSVLVDGQKVEFQMYALKDEDGNDTNYIKLRDLAYVLSGTAAQFEVGWDGAVNIEPGKGYTAAGGEMSTPYSGDRSYEVSASETRINGAAAALEAITLKDDAGNGYTYYKLRDLGEALGFNVGWSADRGVFVETDKPYTAD